MLFRFGHDKVFGTVPFTRIGLSAKGGSIVFLRLCDECCVTIFQPTPQDVEDVDISTAGMRIFHCRDLGDGIYID